MWLRQGRENVAGMGLEPQPHVDEGGHVVADVACAVHVRHPIGVNSNLTQTFPLQVVPDVNLWGYTQ